MSEVQVKDEGGKKKGRQKKQVLRVDFTPMVDMNMLLITFFMFCTTLLKPQVMNITMPAKNKVKEEEGTQSVCRSWRAPRWSRRASPGASATSSRPTAAGSRPSWPTTPPSTPPPTPISGPRGLLLSGSMGSRTFLLNLF